MTDSYGNYIVGVQESPYTPGASIVSGAIAASREIFLDQETPSDPTKPALSYPSGGGTLFQWDPDAQAWV